MKKKKKAALLLSCVSNVTGLPMSNVSGKLGWKSQLKPEAKSDFFPLTARLGLSTFCVLDPQVCLLRETKIVSYIKKIYTKKQVK